MATPLLGLLSARFTGIHDRGNGIATLKYIQMSVGVGKVEVYCSSAVLASASPPKDIL